MLTEASCHSLFRHHRCRRLHSSNSSVPGSGTRCRFVAAEPPPLPLPPIPPSPSLLLPRPTQANSRHPRHIVTAELSLTRCQSVAALQLSPAAGTVAVLKARSWLTRRHGTPRPRPPHCFYLWYSSSLQSSGGTRAPCRQGLLTCTP